VSCGSLGAPYRRIWDANKPKNSAEKTAIMLLHPHGIYHTTQSIKFNLYSQMTGITLSIQQSTNSSLEQAQTRDKRAPCGGFRMPVLQSEPAVNPEDLFERLAEVIGGDRRWYAMHTKPRQEKSLARTLHRAAIPFYLPLITRRTPMRGRVVVSYP